MSKTKGFSVDFHIPNSTPVTRHMHKLDEVKSFVEQYKIPRVIIHSVADKWSGTDKDVAELKQWPVVPDRLDQEDECPICSAINKEKK
jgi:hypothetical protein